MELYAVASSIDRSCAREARKPVSMRGRSALKGLKGCPEASRLSVESRHFWSPEKENGFCRAAFAAKRVVLRETSTEFAATPAG